MQYDPKKWYWIADDGRVYSGPDQNITHIGDAGYAAFTQAGGTPTRWPKDLSGHQTEAALLEVISPYGLVLSPKHALRAYASRKRWEKEVGGVNVNGVVVATDDRSKQMLLGVRLAATADPEFTTPWVGADGGITELNAAQLIAISDAVLAHVKSCFMIFSALKPDIDNGTITTKAQIDAAFA